MSRTWAAIAVVVLGLAAAAGVVTLKREDDSHDAASGSPAPGSPVDGSEPRRPRSAADTPKDDKREGRNENHATKEQGKGSRDGGAHAGKRGAPAKCPEPLTREQCREVGKLYRDPLASPQPQTQPECPEALTAAQCREVGRLYREQRSNPQPETKPECPEVLTPEQCSELGELYRQG